MKREGIEGFHGLMEQAGRFDKTGLASQGTGDIVTAYLVYRSGFE